MRSFQSHHTDSGGQPDVLRRVRASRAWTRAAVALAATLLPWAALAVPGLSTGGGCSRAVGGGTTTDPTFLPSCSVFDELQPAPPGATSAAGSSWTDPRPGTAFSAGWNATATFGILRASAFGSASTRPPLGATIPLAQGLGGNGYAVAIDDIVFGAPGQEGRAATVTGSVHIDGLMSASPGGRGSAGSGWSVTMSILDGNQFAGGGSASGNYAVNGGTIFGNPDVDTIASFNAQVVFGRTYEILMRLDVFAAATAVPAGSPGSPEYQQEVSSSASAEFNHTAAWNGFQSMVLADGTAAQGWSVSSASGINYALPVVAAPVPEPASALLLLPGLALVRRRTRGRCA